MHSPFLISLLITGLASSAIAQQRKSLTFGLVLPHAVFDTTPRSKLNGFPTESAETSPESVARIFIEEQTGLDVNSYYIRDDSYTDKNTGVAHIYARQLIDGVEVVDGDMNINIHDGIVISYGSSFYPGKLDSSSIQGTQNIDPHGDYCKQLSEQLSAHEKQQSLTGSGQVVFHNSDKKASIPLKRTYEHHCSRVSILSSEEHGTLVLDPRRPLLQFMLRATPHQSVMEHIESQHESLIDSMESYFERLSVQGRRTMIQLISNVPDTLSPVKARFAYSQVLVDGRVELHPVWTFEVEMASNWYETSVSAYAPHRIISVADWTSDAPMHELEEPAGKKPATYNVFKWGLNDPSEGERTIEHENVDSLASPVGWHTLPYTKDPSEFYLEPESGEFWKNTTTTWGNNVFVQENWKGVGEKDDSEAWIDRYRPDAGAGLAFDFQYDPKVTDISKAVEEAKKYINVTATQLFYIANMVHDLFYRYGFDELSGNFQQHNFKRGGCDNDAVIINAQDSSDYDGAFFTTTPDGKSPRCVIHLWKKAMPFRDGALESGVVIHELTHGLSNRLTGGPANVKCLGWTDSEGMDEGWSDFMATMVRSTVISKHSDYPMGAWVENDIKGSRHFPYTLDRVKNPSTFELLNMREHMGKYCTGEVWAEMLWTVAQRLIEKHGFSDTLLPPKPLEDGTVPEGKFYRPREYTSTGQKKPLVPIHGNTLMIQLVINAMKLQPCQPSFFTARDAIIQADKVLTGGENECEIWAGFAERGLGRDASVESRQAWGIFGRKDGCKLPDSCAKKMD